MVELIQSEGTYIKVCKNCKTEKDCMKILLNNKPEFVCKKCLEDKYLIDPERLKKLLGFI